MISGSKKLNSKQASGRKNAGIVPNPSESRQKTDPPVAKSRKGAGPRSSLAHSLEILAKTLNEFMFVMDSDGTIRTAWTTSDTFLTRPSAILIRERLRDVLGRKDFIPIAKIFRRVLKTGRNEYFEHEVHLPAGLRWFVLRVMPVAHSRAGSRALCVFAVDITERKNAQEKLQRSEALLAQAEQLARLGSFEVNFQSNSIIWSDQLYRNLGLKPQPEPFDRELFLQMIHPDDRARVRSETERAIARNEILDSELRCILPNGDIRTLHRRAFPVYNEKGEPEGIVGMSQDVTGRHKAEERLRKSEGLLAQAEKLANLGSWEWNLETGEVTWSEQGYRLMGMDPAQSPPTIEQFWQFLHPDDRERVSREFQTAMDDLRPLEYEARFVLNDGQVRTVHTRALPIANAEGRASRLVGMSQDITERRKEEERLRHSEALLAQAEEIANFGSWEFEVKTGRVTLSKQLLRMYGLRSDTDWDRERYWDNVLLNNRGHVRKTVEQAIAACKPFEYVARYRMPDGTQRIYHSRGLPIAGNNGAPEFVRGVVHDITGQTQKEEDLHRLSQDLIRTQDAERRILALDLHESAGQSLAALKMTLANLEDALAEDPSSANDLLQSARGLAEDAVREVRVVSHLMHPTALDEAGLGPALHYYARGFSDRSGIKAIVEVGENVGRQPREIELTVFRIVQEALTNVHRYSGSPTVSIQLARRNGEIRIEVRDEGRGLPLPNSGDAVSSTLGVGIPGMRERVKQLNGILELESAPGRGTTVRAVLPLLREEALRSSAGERGESYSKPRKGE